jgi:hypothetical protein
VGRLARYRPLVAGQRWHRRETRVAGTIAVLALAGAPATAGLARVASPDRTPPTFAGLESATTCTPGPIGGGRSSSYRLSWEAAKDDVTPQKKIVYDIYQATSPGGEVFSSATYTARHGATTFTTPPLPADKAVYFVVRARDRAGNRDSNQVERQGANLCV